MFVFMKKYSFEMFCSKCLEHLYTDNDENVRAKHGERSSKHVFAFDSRHFSNTNEVITSGGTGKDVKAIVTHDQGGGGKDVIT